jgi:hypothetical protein
MKNFESKMTLSAGISVNKHNEIPEEFSTYDLPVPEGTGWQLKQIIPVHNNHRFLQYFWEREVEGIDGADNDFETNAQVKNTSIKLHI